MKVVRLMIESLIRNEFKIRENNVRNGSQVNSLANNGGCIEGCIGCFIQIIGGCTEMYCRMY